MGLAVVDDGVVGLFRGRPFDWDVNLVCLLSPLRGATGCELCLGADCGP